jgi:hypothetical protein
MAEGRKAFTEEEEEESTMMMMIIIKQLKISRSLFKVEQSK